VPLALMGLNEGVNTFIDAEGKGIDKAVYIPAYSADIHSSSPHHPLGDERRCASTDLRAVGELRGRPATVPTVTSRARRPKPFFSLRAVRGSRSAHRLFMAEVRKSAC
jgi:hypothetical protein